MEGKREGGRGAFSLPHLSLTCTCCLSLSLASTRAIHIADIAVQQFPPKLTRLSKPCTMSHIQCLPLWQSFVLHRGRKILSSMHKGG